MAFPTSSATISRSFPFSLVYLALIRSSLKLPYTVLFRELHQREHELSESAALLERTGEMARVGGWEVDAKTEVVTWTPQTYRIHEMPFEFVPSLEQAVDFFHPEDRPKLATAVRQALERGTPYDIEIRLITARGKTLWTRTLCRPEVADGRTVKLRGVFQDITASKNLQQQIQQARKTAAISTLAAGIAHHFNNMLTSILGFTELAIDDAAHGSIQEGNLRQVHQAGRRAQALVEQMLSFARLETRKTGPVPVAAVIAEAVRAIAAKTPATVQIATDIHGDVCMLADRTDIQTMLMNLCSNAVDAMADKGGTLRVGLTEIHPVDDDQHPRLRITVADSGGGIAAADIDRIFDPYFTTKNDDGRTGMGLAVVHAICESYGGAITVDSTPGQGTVFSLELPVTVRRQACRAGDAAQLPLWTEPR